MKKLIITLAICSLWLGAQSEQANAASAGGNIAEQPCDTNYWRQLTARAWLEAEREIMQNQNLIFKPDSVLAYVCFDKFLDVAAGPGGKIFTHTKYFGKEIVTRQMDEGMNKALTAVVSKALSNYIQNNFGHKLLGGRGEFMGISDADQKQKAATVTGESASYECTTMANVWATAKCANFVDNSEFQEKDGFYPFEKLVGHNGGKDVKSYSEIVDTRAYPTACGTPKKPASGTSIVGPHSDASKSQSPTKGTWAEQIQYAENKNNLYEFKTPLNKIFEDVNKKLKPAQNKSDCGEAIKTGVEVYVLNKRKGEDGVCTNPGCSYVDGSCQ